MILQGPSFQMAKSTSKGICGKQEKSKKMGVSFFSVHVFLCVPPHPSATGGRVSVRTLCVLKTQTLTEVVCTEHRTQSF